MDSFFSSLFDWLSMMIQVMDENFVFSVGGFSFSLWDFEVACFLLCIIVPAIMITRSQSVDTQVSERAPLSEHEWLEDQTAYEIERGTLDVNRAASRWADYYERRGV